MDAIANLKNIVIYQSETGSKKIEVLYDSEDFWLTQKTMAELFNVKTNTINYHLKEIFDSGELKENSVIRKIRITATDGKKYNTNFYSLDAIIAVGYRINSKRATDFRIWATKILKEYIIKSFSLNDEFLKNNGESSYFEELLARIREIRSSEKVFWRKVLDIYATAIDYDSKSEISITFFKTVQNKMHYATHGQTAAENLLSKGLEYALI